MSLWTALSLVGQPLISFVAVSGTINTGIENGLFERMGVDSGAVPRLVESCDSLDKIIPTAHAIWEGMTETLLKFFIPVADDANTSLGIQGYHFLAVWMSAWILVYMESFRKGSMDPAKIFVAFFGLLMEFIGIGITMPWWCALNILFSYTTTSNIRASTSISATDLKLIPRSLFIGAGITTLGMKYAPWEAASPYVAKNFWILARLYHPVISVIAHRILRLFVSSNDQPKPAGRSLQALKSTRRLYRAAFWLCTLIHIGTILALAAAQYYPDHLSANLVLALKPENVWPATSPWHDWASQRIGSIPTGVGLFLFWDEVATSLSILLWAFTVNQIALRRSLGLQTVGRLLKMVVLSALVGPSAVAVMLIQEKDEKMV